MLSFPVRRIHRNAWLLILLSAGLQILIFPLPNLYVLCWVAMAPMLLALLRAQRPATLQFTEGIKLLPANPAQGFVLGYACGILWFLGTCYWIYDTMRQYGGLNTPAALGILVLFCLYLGLYHGLFGLLIALVAGGKSGVQRALVAAPFLWVAVELARTRITAFPWDLLGIAQVDNIPLSRLARVTGVYGISCEIMIVNVAFAAAFLVPRERRFQLLLAAVAAAMMLQSGRLINPAPLPTDKTALLVQENVPILEASDWTREYFDNTMRELASLSLTPPGGKRPDLIAWPESPAPFYTSDPLFREGLGNVARASHTWVLAGSLGIRTANQTPQKVTELYNSGALFSPEGELVSRYDKVHLVPFGEYVPFKSIFSFAGGLTKEVGDFTHGASRDPLDAGGTRLGVFICYESVFPDEVRQFAGNGAQVFVNISNDGWYGDSGAYAQHLKQARMRAMENDRWLLRDTNTGVTASIDPYGRVVASVPRKVRTVLEAPYALTNVTTFYSRHGDWFAYLCAIISVAALLMRLPFRRKIER
ncbi:MAG TPA: apolipoprotein N-acyltransferase [Terriglobales bacterium]|nr:apolipoprotein N-acyltransferase [Terriglobales bacterium]